MKRRWSKYSSTTVCEGYRVFTATDGGEGLQRAQEIVPDLIVLDIMLPTLDGLQLCSLLRSDPETQNIRILMLTAKGEEVDEVIGFNMGADDYVIKLYKLHPLLHRIKALLRRPLGEIAQDDIVESWVSKGSLKPHCQSRRQRNGADANRTKTFVVCNESARADVQSPGIAGSLPW